MALTQEMHNKFQYFMRPNLSKVNKFYDSMLYYVNFYL